MMTMMMTMVLERYRHRYHNPAGWCYHHRRCRRPCCCWTKTMAPYYCSYSFLFFLVFSCFFFNSSFLLLCIFFDNVQSISLSLSLCVYAFQSSLLLLRCIDVVRNQSINQSIKSIQCCSVRRRNKFCLIVVV